MNPFLWEKQSWESIILPFDASDFVDDDDTIAGVDATMYDSKSTDVSAAMIEGVPSFVGTTVYTQVKAGTDNETYSLRLRITTTAGEKFEDDLQVEVAEKVYGGAS